MCRLGLSGAWMWLIAVGARERILTVDGITFIG